MRLTSKASQRRRARVLALAATVALGTASAVAGMPAGAAPAAPNDSLYPQQWGLPMSGAAQAWTTSTGAGVTIGVVDTGADLTHEDLAAHVSASTNCIGAAGDPSKCKGSGQDDHGHGTHVSGIAAAVTGNGVGVAGMAPDARLVVAKALDSNGAGSVDDINAGIMWVVGHGARVVNLSLGDPNFFLTALLGTSLQTGIEYAWSHGAIPVLAAGNTNFLGLGSSNYGSLDAVVVAAAGRDGKAAGYSSPTGNAKWAIMAPGGSADKTAGDDILSTIWYAGKHNQYGTLAGTSMATPFVAGALALLLAAHLSPADAVNRLLSNANHSVACPSGSQACTGRLDAAAAVAGLPSVTPPTTTTTTTPAGGGGGGSSGGSSGGGRSGGSSGGGHSSGSSTATTTATTTTTTTTTPGTTNPGGGPGSGETTPQTGAGGVRPPSAHASSASGSGSGGGQSGGFDVLGALAAALILAEAVWLGRSWRRRRVAQPN
ncbi:MAG: S8 family serine peptidase [Acidimicrobiales bacterium]